MFGASIFVNKLLRPLKEEVGEVIGEVIADLAGASGASRSKIVNNTRRVANISGSLAISAAMGDVTGVADVIDGLS
jgi:hypothetical protein